MYLVDMKTIQQLKVESDFHCTVNGYECSQIAAIKVIIATVLRLKYGE